MATALKQATEAGKPLLLDFYASWCIPCRKLEKDLERPEVKKVLADFHVVRVDTDKHPRASNYFNVKALPTLIVLDGKGKERFRRVGLIVPRDLTSALADVSKEISGGP